MMVFDRFNIRVFAVGAGLCSVAVTLSPDALAAPLVTGGYGCFAPAAGPAVAPPCAPPPAAPVADMAGVPMALPGPVPVVPAAPPLPIPPVAPPVPVVPAAPPVAAPVPAAPVPAAPFVPMAGPAKDKGLPTSPPAGAPVAGQPLIPGPQG